MVAPGVEVFGWDDDDKRLEVSEEDNGQLVLRVKGATVNGTTATIAITLDAEELARGLITASHSFGQAIADVARAAIFSSLVDSEA